MRFISVFNSLKPSAEAVKLRLCCCWP